MLNRLIEFDLSQATRLGKGHVHRAAVNCTNRKTQRLIEIKKNPHEMQYSEKKITDLN